MGKKLYNILIDGIFDSSKDSKYLNYGESTVRIGDKRLYNEKINNEDETFNISIQNVFSRAKYALMFAGTMKNVKYNNINVFSDKTVLLKE